MNERKSFYVKLGYLAAIVVLLFPLSMLSSPSTQEDPGGKISQMRDKLGFSLAKLGEIDPASVTMKLATLGMRGIACNILWNKAHEYKMKEQWSKFSATLDQLSKLQPNFISFWRFQSWNVTYNISVEFDDYHDRYYYVIRGINFLKEGTKYNRDNPYLLSDVGWFIGNKIGRADEHVQYRRLFKTDENFHPKDRLPEDRDNWLVAKIWHSLASGAVLNRGKPLGKKNGAVFFAKPAKALISYADAIEKEGVLDHRATSAWVNAGKEWDIFGNIPIAHSTGVKMLLSNENLERLNKELEQAKNDLDSLVPNLRAKIKEEREAKLTKVQQEVMKIEPERLTPDQYSIADDVKTLLRVSDLDLAVRIGELYPEKKKEALRLSRKLQETTRLINYTENYRETSNFAYWKARTEYEVTPEALAAATHLYKADQAYQNSDIESAKEHYKKGFAEWKKLLDNFPVIRKDDTSTSELMDIIVKYKKVLDQANETISDDFPLWDIIEENDFGRVFAQEAAERKARQMLESALKNSDKTEPKKTPTEKEPSDTDEKKIKSNDVTKDKDVEKENKETTDKPQDNKIEPDASDTEVTAPSAEPASEQH